MFSLELSFQKEDGALQRQRQQQQQQQGIHSLGSHVPNQIDTIPISLSIWNIMT